MHFKGSGHFKIWHWAVIQFHPLTRKLLEDWCHFRDCGYTATNFHIWKKTFSKVLHFWMYSTSTTTVYLWLNKKLSGVWQPWWKSTCTTTEYQALQQEHLLISNIWKFCIFGEISWPPLNLEFSKTCTILKCCCWIKIRLSTSQMEPLILFSPSESCF